MGLTLPTGLILDALAEGFRYGFDIMDATGLPSGTVYPALRRLEAQGLVASRWEDEAVAGAEGRPARRYYQLTGEGARVLAQARQRFPALSRRPSAGLRPGEAPA